MPITLPYLGAEKYGVWMTLLSLVALVGITDLGMNNALITIVARADARGDHLAVQRYLSTAVALFTGIAVCLGTIALVVFPLIPWESVFHIASGPGATQAERAAAAVLIIYLLNLPAGIVLAVRRGFQEGYTNGWWEMAGAAITVAAVALAVSGGATLLALVTCAAVAPLVMNLANWGLLVRKRPTLRPRFRSIGGREARALLHSGGLFFVLQIAFVVGFSSDNLVAASVLGPEAVTDYAIPSRLALAGMSFLAVFVAPLWPAYAEALARNDTSWTIRTLRRSVTSVAVVATFGALIFVAVGKPLIRMWTQGEVDPGWPLLFGLGLFLILGSVGNAIAMFLNAAHIVGFQVVCATLMAVSNIVLSVILARHVGVAGLIWGTVISYTLFSIIPLALALPRMLRRLGAGTPVG